jgi:hypothetical protein
MKTSLLLFFTTVIFYSCKPYQYLTITNNTLPPAGSNTYSTVHDSLKVSYNFDGYNALLQLSIENKSNSPIIIDWKKSAIVTNGTTLSLFNTAVVFTAKASFDTAYNNAQILSSSINGQMVLPGETDFIPPHAGIHKKTTASINGPLNIVFTPGDKVAKDNIYQQKTKINSKIFTAENSPGKIRVYLTYSINYGVNKSIDTEFFVSEILSIAKNPDEMLELFGKTLSTVYTY